MNIKKESYKLSQEEFNLYLNNIKTNINTLIIFNDSTKPYFFLLDKKELTWLIVDKGENVSSTSEYSQFLREDYSGAMNMVQLLS